MQYENNLRKNVLQRKKQKIWFSKSLFPKGTSGKGGSSYIRVNMVLLNNGSIFFYSPVLHVHTVHLL